MGTISAIKGSLQALKNALLQSEAQQLAAKTLALDDGTRAYNLALSRGASKEAADRARAYSLLTNSSPEMQDAYKVGQPVELVKRHLPPDVYEKLSTLREQDLIKQLSDKYKLGYDDNYDKLTSQIKSGLSRLVEPKQASDLGLADSMIYHGSRVADYPIPKGLRKLYSDYTGNVYIPKSIRESLWATSDPAVANTYRSSVNESLPDFADFAAKYGIDVYKNQPRSGALFQARIPPSLQIVGANEDRALGSGFYSKLLQRPDVDLAEILNSSNELNLSLYKPSFPTPKEGISTTFAIPSSKQSLFNWERID